MNMSTYPFLRRIRISWLDVKVARSSMRICHQSFMQQLYISRLDINKQFVVISNPTNANIDLTGYMMTNTSTKRVFKIPRGYILLSGDEVTIWCSPGSIDLDSDNLLQPYLFWTQPDGCLENSTFFSKGSTNEAILLDPYYVEVASLQVSKSGKQDFRVLHSVFHRTESNKSQRDSNACLGCLSPTANRSGHISRKRKHNRNYVFSRYWGVVSDKSAFSHMLAVVLCPLIECIRALLIIRLAQGSHGWNQQILQMIFSTSIFCDIFSRYLCLYIKSGVLVSLISFSSFLLDQIMAVSLYLSLSTLYPLQKVFLMQVLSLELSLSVVTAAAYQMGLIQERNQWDCISTKLFRLNYQLRKTSSFCTVCKETMLWMLHFLPFQNTSSAGNWKVVSFYLIPVFTLSILADFVHSMIGVFYLVRRPLLVNEKTMKHC